jgi:F-type H+-transporting ATPase subunit delta
VAGPLLWTPQSDEDAHNSCAPPTVFDRPKGWSKAEDSGRVDVSETASISLGIAGRYAQALFELAQDTGGLKALEADVKALTEVLAESPEFAAMILPELEFNLKIEKAACT